MTKNKSLREVSRTNVVSADGEHPYIIENITAGSLQRIADATEKMAQNYTQMEYDLKRYKELWMQYRDQAEYLKRSNAALRGHVGRLKRKLEENDNGNKK